MKRLLKFLLIIRIFTHKNIFLLKTGFKPFKPTFCNKVASHIKKQHFWLAFTGDKCFIFAHQL
jgi:hypothetical protein